MVSVCQEGSNIQLRPLKDPIVLYIDDSPESQQAEELFKQTGIQPVITTGPVESFERKPLALYGGGTYEGFDEIRGLIDLLRFWSQETETSDVFVAI